jgi:co-chaperonin GroES (HSP10)
MNISVNYVAVKKFEDKPKEGFQTVEVQDNSIFKGVISILPHQPVFIGNQQLDIGNVVYFSKYSPDTQDIEHNGEKYKFVRVQDLLAVL